MKKALLICSLLTFILVGLICNSFSLTKAYATDEDCFLVVGQTYTYIKENIICEYTICENNQYEAKESIGENINNFSGTYSCENKIIKFYVADILKGQYTIGDGNTLVDYSLTTENSETSENIEWLKNIGNWIISGIVSIAGSTAIGIIFKTVLKKIVDDILTFKKESKEKIETGIKKLEEEKELFIAQKEEFEKEKAEFLQQRKEFYANSKDAILTIAGGFKELVANGTAEKVKEKFNAKNK